MHALRALLGGIVCLLLVAPAASAQTRDSATAEALFRAGREAATKGDYATACARFRESNRLDREPGTVFNLGDCNEKIGKLASAWQRFREVVQILPPTDPRVAVARRRAAALEHRVPHLTLRLAPGVPDSVTVLRDHVELGHASFGLSLPVDPGQHVVTVRSTGHDDKRYTLSLGEGEARELVVQPGPASKPDSAPAPSPAPGAPPPQDRGADDGSTLRTTGYVVGGVGVAGIAGSMVLGAMVLSRKDVVNTHCQNKRCDQQGLDAASAGRTLSTASTVSFIAGAVCTGVGVTLVLTHRSPERAAVEARTVPGGATLNLGGRF